MTDPLRPAGPGGRDEQQHGRGLAARLALERTGRWGRGATVAGVGDGDGVFQLRDRAAGELLGWSAADLRCAPYGEWVHPDDRDRLADQAATVRDTGHGARFCPVEVRLLARDRHYWWTRWHLWTCTDQSGVCLSGVDYVGRDRDIGPPVGTWCWDVDADTVVWSPELLDMFDLEIGPPPSYDEFLGRIHDEDRDAVDRAVRWSVISSEPYVTDFRARGMGDGRDHWFHAAGRVEPGIGELTGQLCGIVKYLNPPHNP